MVRWLTAGRLFLYCVSKFIFIIIFTLLIFLVIGIWIPIVIWQYSSIALLLAVMVDDMYAPCEVAYHINVHFLFVFIFVFTGWREVVVVTLLESEWRRMVEHPRSGNDDGDASSDAGSDSYWGKGMTPHGKWVFSVFPLAVTGVGGGSVTLSSSLLPLSLLLLLLSLSADVIFAVFILRFHRCYCYLRRFQFSFS